MMNLAWLALAALTPAGAEKLDLSTYYPEPSAAYGALTVSGKSVLARDGGRVGIGTANPLSLLHIDGANPSVRLEASGRGAFDLVNFDLAGDKTFALRNPATGVNTLLIDRNGRVGMYTPDVSGSLGMLTIESDKPLLIKGENVAGVAQLGELILQQNPADPISRSWEIGTHNQAFSIHQNRADPWSLFDISENGNIWVGKFWGLPAPIHKFQFENGGHLTVAGVWMTPSSRTFKFDVHPVDDRRTLDAVMALEPVAFRYKLEPEQPKLGFIADDVPELVGRKDRLSVSSMDVATALASVLQAQKKKIAELKRQLDELEREAARD